MAANDRKLTARQVEILEFVRDYGRTHGFPPSVRDVGKRFGLNSATAYGHLKALERKGYIEKQPHLSRSLRIVDGVAGEEAPKPGREVPIVGRVAAGAPILAEQNIDDVVRLPDAWIPEGAFLLRVRGESMRDAHILDGDLVLVRPQATASNGEIVVALIDDDATVKRFRRTREGIELRPENAAFNPISVSPDRPFSIVGKVVGVFRL